MHPSVNWRRLGNGVLVATLGVSATVVGVVAGVATPAHATGGWFTRYEVTSAFDTTSPKSVVAGCPEGELVHSTGGRVNGADGGVALTEIVPNAGLTSVTAEGKARPGHVGAWSVTAFAVCNDPIIERTDPVRVTSGPVVGSTAAASCTNGRQLTGVGFDVVSEPSFVHKVQPNSDLTRVDVAAAGTGIFVGVRAFGICAYHPEEVPFLLQGSAGPNDNPTQTAVTPDVGAQPWLKQSVFVLGGRVSGGPGNVMLDGLVPQNNLTAARASAAVVSPLPWLGLPRQLVETASAGVDTDDDYSTIVYADYTDWY